MQPRRSGREGPRGAYRMQVTEAACWSFMLFLRSRMLSEDWYTWTLWIRACTCDTCWAHQSLESPLHRFISVSPPPPPPCQVPTQGAEAPSLPVGLRPSGSPAGSTPGV